MKVTVIGATGTIGREVVDQLAGAGVDVRAVSRRPEGASFAKNVEAVRGDLTDPATLDVAGDAAFLVWTAPAAAAPAAIERIARQVRRIVLLTAPHNVAHPFFQQTNPMARMLAEVERLIVGSGVPWTFLRPGMFSENARV